MLKILISLIFFFSNVTCIWFFKFLIFFSSLTFSGLSGFAQSNLRKVPDSASMWKCILCSSSWLCSWGKFIWLKLFAFNVSVFLDPNFLYVFLFLLGLCEIIKYISALLAGAVRIRRLHLWRHPPLWGHLWQPVMLEDGIRGVELSLIWQLSDHVTCVVYWPTTWWGCQNRKCTCVNNRCIRSRNIRI